ncbi:hypothetical protein ACHAWF_001994 [Thalassiosira exigua]
MTMSSIHSCPAGIVPAPTCRRRAWLSSNSLHLCCIVALAMLGSLDAFQSSLLTATPPPAATARHRTTITRSLSSNDDFFTETSAFDLGEGNSSDDQPSSGQSAGFGESVPYVPLSQRGSNEAGSNQGVLSMEGGVDEAETLAKNRIRNVAVAVASFAVAVFNYGWQFTHPVTAVEILQTMEKQSSPLTAIGNNGKPTVIDFWAPWCSNCKVTAPTLQAVEQEYGDRVNFIMVNGDDGRNWPLIQLFGVDAIPHLAFVSGEGDVETALIGPIPRTVLRADIDALLSERKDCEVEVPVCRDELPYKMFDAFGNRPDSRRINFVEK